MESRRTSISSLLSRVPALSDVHWISVMDRQLSAFNVQIRSGIIAFEQVAAWAVSVAGVYSRST